MSLSWDLRPRTNKYTVHTVDYSKHVISLCYTSTRLPAVFMWVLDIPCQYSVVLYILSMVQVLTLKTVHVYSYSMLLNMTGTALQRYLSDVFRKY